MSKRLPPTVFARLPALQYKQGAPSNASENTVNRPGPQRMEANCAGRRWELSFFTSEVRWYLQPPRSKRASPSSQ